MRFKMLINSLWSRCSWWLRWFLASCALLPLLLSGAAVNATSTPNIVTPTPNGVGTSTPAGYGYDTAIPLDFRTADQFYTADTGSRLDGAGWLSVGGVLDMHGNGNTYGPVSRVSLLYTALSTGTLEITITVGGDLVYNAAVSFSTCTNCTNMNFTLPNVDLDDIHIEVTSSALFTLKVLTMIVRTGSEPEPTAEIVGGCPVLTQSQIDRLDPGYMRSCGRCFVTPTPPRAQTIPTRQVASLPTGTSGTDVFSIPILVSGTAVTATPPGYVAPAATPAPGTATWTPLPTSTPYYDMLDFNFLGTEDNGFVISFDPSASPNTYYGDFEALGLRSNYIDSSSFGSITRQYVQASRTISISGIQAVGYEIYNPSAQSITIESYFGGGGANFRTYHGSTTISDFFLTSPNWNIYDILLNVYSGTFADSGAHFYVQHLYIQTSDIVTPVPTNTPTATVTGAPYVQPQPTETLASCAAPVFRNDTPLMEIPEFITVTGYECYVVVPEMNINIPGQADDLEIVGAQICVTWFTWPTINFLGLPIPIEFVVIMSVLGWLVRRLLTF